MSDTLREKLQASLGKALLRRIGLPPITTR